MIHCPPDCKKQYSFSKEINNYDIYDCTVCNHRLAYIDRSPEHVNANYDDTYFFDGGTGGYPNYYKESELLYKRGKRYARILNRNGANKGKILDVGAAAGFILKGFVDKGWDGTGIEPNKTMVTYANEELNLNVYQSTLEEFTFDGKFDCIALIQVIAHFYDFEKAINKITSLLKKDGYLLIETWNRNSITARVFGWKWHEYSPPTVIHWFTKKDLLKYMEKAGFKLVKSGRMLKRINARHAKSLILEKVSNKIFRRMINIIPDKLKLLYPSEDLFYLILKKK